jgi:choline dehydrogenase-like flavoprotein
MLIDARSLASSERLDTDLCIVGSGPAGITVARAFDGTGVRVCVLESGGVTLESAAQVLNAGESVGYSYHFLHQARTRAFGGSSVRWPLRTSGGDEGWIARPLDPIDFEVRPEIPYSGWPFARAELEPYYVQAQEAAGLGRYAYDVESWETPGLSRLPLNTDDVETRILHRGSTNFTEHLRQMKASHNICLLIHATVVEIVVDERGERVERLRVVQRPGAEFGVCARLFVLAAGGIENPRLLLLSVGRQPVGIGNSHDLVGRFFMERLSARAALLQPTSPTFGDRLGLYISHLSGADRVHGALGITGATMRREGLLNAIFWLNRKPPAFTAEGVRSLITLVRALRRQPRPEGLLGHARNVIADLDDIVRAVLHQRHLIRSHDVAFTLGVQAEQAPNPASRVTLAESTDRFGLRLARLDWRLSDMDRQSIRHSEELLDRHLRAAGLGRLRRMLGDEHPPVLFIGNHHHMGTTRMHADPRYGVVDPASRVHDLANLYIAGSSVFPTAGSSNPTLTIVALSLRLADELRRALAPPVLAIASDTAGVAPVAAAGVSIPAVEPAPGIA